MAKGKKTKELTESQKFLKAIENEKYEDAEIGQLCRDYMIIFGLNNNIMRHIPSLYDGLKPGERRILYSMYNSDLKPTSRYQKCGRIVGNVLAYHPHGDTPIYETLVKLAQEWSMTTPLIDGHGNFGSVTGDGAAAMRYTEARLTKFAWKTYFEEFDENVLDMIPNNTGDCVEPEYLPARYPVGLVNGTSGIGYGAACIIPPHNFSEVIDATIALIEDPEADIFLVPDSPTGCDIVDNGELQKINDTGVGKLLFRGKVIKTGDRVISIHSVPWQISFEKVKTDIIKYSKENKIVGIHDFFDHNKGHQLDYKIQLKREADPNKIIDTCFKKTFLEQTKPVAFVMIDDFEPVELNNKKFLLEWIDRRIEIKRRIVNHKLIKLKGKEHTLSILTFILKEENYTATVEKIRYAENRQQIVDYLVNDYGISSLQAKFIADMKLTSFTKSSVRKYKEDLEKVRKEIEKLEKITKSSKKIKKIIIEELEEGKKLFGVPRRSQIIKLSGEVAIPDTNHLLVITSNGNIKKLPEDATNIGQIEQGDTPIETLLCSNLSELLLFDRFGKVFKLPIHEIDNTTFDSFGDSIKRYANVQGGICRMVINPTQQLLDNMKTNVYVVFVTKNGLIKKTLVNEYMNIRNEIMAIDIKEDDELRTVKFINGDKEIIVYTENGFGIRFNTSDVKSTGRFTKGVKALTLENDNITGMEVIGENEDAMFMVTDKGNAKISLMDTFEVSERNSAPLKLIGLSENEHLIFVNTKQRGVDVNYNVFMKNDLLTISSADTNELPRMSKGKKLIPVRKGDSIISIVRNK